MYLERSIPDPSLRPEVAFHVLDLADWQPLWPPVAAAVAEQFPFVQVWRPWSPVECLWQPLKQTRFAFQVKSNASWLQN